MQVKIESIKSDRRVRGEEMLGRVDGEAGIRVVENLAASFPEFANYVLEYPFGDIYSRSGLGLRERELSVVAALCAMGNAAPQLRVHIHAALHVGCTPREILEVLMMMSVYVASRLR
jgi:4-carboxymuconolactone decarboxylase